MKIEFIKLIDHFWGAFCLAIAVHIIGFSIINKKANIKSFKCIACLVIFSLIFIINYLLFDNPFRIINSFFILTIYYKILLKEETKKSMIISFIMLILLTISEMIFSVVVGVFFYFNPKINKLIFLENSFVNIIMTLMALLMFNAYKKRIKEIVEKYNSKTRIYIIIGIIIILMIFGTLFMNIINNEISINKNFYIDLFMIMLFVTISAILLFQEFTKTNLLEKYKVASEYMRVNADLIEKYSLIQHQYKNQLIILKSYAEKKDNKMLPYIKELLNDYQYDKYEWITKINYLNIEELKYLIFHKLADAENAKLNLDIQVSKEIAKIDFSHLNIKEINNLVIIAGEYLDNAIYASKESKKKELHYDSYLDDEKLIIEICNSYGNSVNLQKISKKGYSTKGKNRGLGIYEIDKIIKNSDCFTTLRSIKKKYFTAKIMINLKK